MRGVNIVIINTMVIVVIFGVVVNVATNAGNLVSIKNKRIGIVLQISRTANRNLY